MDIMRYLENGLHNNVPKLPTQNAVCVLIIYILGLSTGRLYHARVQTVKFDKARVKYVI